MRQAVQLELTFTVETPEAAGGLVIQQAGGGDQAPAVKIAHADVCAMGVELISVQTAFGAFQACFQLVAEYGEAQGLCLEKGAPACQAHGLQTT